MFTEIAQNSSVKRFCYGRKKNPLSSWHVDVMMIINTCPRNQKALTFFAPLLLTSVLKMLDPSLKILSSSVFFSNSTICCSDICQPQNKTFERMENKEKRPESPWGDNE